MARPPFSTGTHIVGDIVKVWPDKTELVFDAPTLLIYHTIPQLDV